MIFLRVTFAPPDGPKGSAESVGGPRHFKWACELAAAYAYSGLSAIGVATQNVRRTLCLEKKITTVVAEIVVRSGTGKGLLE